ncbi:hypothetical protein GTW37_11585, partial [Streptomyces sp. SID4931]|nr:hypothetical protein [Streptomyces sp. SID4931]
MTRLTNASGRSHSSETRATTRVCRDKRQRPTHAALRCPGLGEGDTAPCPKSTVPRRPRSAGWTRFVTARPRLALLAALVITALAVFAGSGVADRMGSGGWQAP